MGMAAFLKAGAIVGTGLQKGREKLVCVTAFTHEITTPIDPTTKKPGGTRRHGPFIITKNVDIATPAFHAAQAGSVALEPWELRLYHMPRSGPEAHYFTITLKGARRSEERRGGKEGRERGWAARQRGQSG